MKNSEKLIVSLYDYTCGWVQPYIDAGYPVMPFDLKHEGDILQNWGWFLDNIIEAVEAGYYPYGLLSATPCTDFASSGVRHFEKKDASRERCGHKDYFENTVEMHIFLAELIFPLMEQVEKHTGHCFKFWALENPVGRIERLCPSLKPYRIMLFNPCDFGDPYTKKTVLWGDFNSNLVKNPVEPEFIIWGGKKYPKLFVGTGGKSEKTKSIRSATPAGFANAFFQANQ